MNSERAAQCAACSQCQAGCHLHESQERERLRRLYETAVARAERAEDRAAVLTLNLDAKAKLAAAERERLTARVCDLQREVHNKDLAGRRVLDHVRALLATPQSEAAEAEAKALREALFGYRRSQQHMGCECPACERADAALAAGRGGMK